MSTVILDLNQIKSILPHRDPVLCIERARLLSDRSVRAYLYADPRLNVFSGHFKEYPVLPGTYLLEAMTQTAGLILLSQEAHCKKMPLFVSVRSLRFLRQIRPGDSVSILAEQLTDPVADMVDFKVTAFIREEKASVGFLTLAFK